MRRQFQRTRSNPLNRLDCVDHLQNCQLRRRSSQRYSTAQAPLRMHNARSPQALQHLRKICPRHARRLGNFVGCSPFGVFAGQIDHRPKRIFHGLRKHANPRFFQKWILTSTYRLLSSVGIGLVTPILPRRDPFRQLALPAPFNQALQTQAPSDAPAPLTPPHLFPSETSPCTSDRFPPWLYSSSRLLPLPPGCQPALTPWTKPPAT